LADAPEEADTVAERDLSALIAQMTLEEKASLCSGLDRWLTKPIDRLGIPSIRMADGPHGLRKERHPDQEMSDSLPSTCFPTAAALAASWDPALLEAVGQALAEECLAEDVQILLGPGVNLKRHPLCGRNFEYLSEDPHLAGALATAYIRGVQGLGVGTSLKHFAANNQETLRLSIDALVDERTLRELYLAQFEAAVKDGRPWTVMAAYNQLNGAYCSEHPWLLTTVLREEWGFSGIVVSDWGAVNDRVEALRAGLDLEMPFATAERDQAIVDAVRRGALPETVLDEAVRRLLTVIFCAHDHRRPGFQYDREAHHALARRAAEASAVLLKNEDQILPLDPTTTSLAVIGAFAKSPRIQGGGSSRVHPYRVEAPWDQLVELAGAGADLSYAPGYALDSDEPAPHLIAEAARLAAAKQVAVLFVGLPDGYESEGFDRKDLRLPASHLRLIEAVTQVQPNVVVVLSAGSPVEMPWLPHVKGVLLSHLGGEAVGGAVARLLYGHVNPSGKLAETYPVQLQDTPAYITFPGGTDSVPYGEGVFVGYRYYDQKGLRPLFPFGFGLSYTTFEYRRIAVEPESVRDSDPVRVTVEVANTGRRAGEEIVQLYVAPPTRTAVVRPPKELKGFAKIALAPGETKTVTFNLDGRAFAYWATELGTWRVESGTYSILVGPSSAYTPLRAGIAVTGTTRPVRRVDRKTKIGQLLAMPETAPVVEEVIARRLEVLRQSMAARESRDGKDVAERWLRALQEGLPYSDLRQLVGRFGGFSEADLAALIDRLNAKLQG
jgi:beta-glucosidase